MHRVSTGLTAALALVLAMPETAAAQNCSDCSNASVVTSSVSSQTGTPWALGEGTFVFVVEVKFAISGDEAVLDTEIGKVSGTFATTAELLSAVAELLGITDLSTLRLTSVLKRDDGQDGDAVAPPAIVPSYIVQLTISRQQAVAAAKRLNAWVDRQPAAVLAKPPLEFLIARESLAEVLRQFKGR